MVWAWVCLGPDQQQRAHEENQLARPRPTTPEHTLRCMFEEPSHLTWSGMFHTEHFFSGIWFTILTLIASMHDCAQSAAACTLARGTTAGRAAIAWATAAAGVALLTLAPLMAVLTASCAVAKAASLGGLRVARASARATYTVTCTCLPYLIAFSLLYNAGTFAMPTAAAEMGPPTSYGGHGTEALRSAVS